MHFQQQLQAYGQWKSRLVEAIDKYHAWLKKYELSTTQVEEVILGMRRNLASERMTIAFVAEFSRGKTELINALFFAETGVRLLPSTPGRTTMCPTEIFYDPEGGGYIRLLAIESRLDNASLSEYKDQPGQWLQIELDPSSPIQMQEAFQELVAVKRVSLEEAKRLGLYHDDMNHPGDIPPDSVEIPCWRHALISFPHPLLQEGLVILDTPGLNALGSEPELTLSMLPSAQAILFVLAADTGVTKSDMDMWQHHVRGLDSDEQRHLAVVMNKIDTLWDDLQSESHIDKSIQSQVKETARILGVEEKLIFSLSAKQSLLAKVKDDETLLEKSRLTHLENYLGKDVLQSRQEIMRRSITRGIGHQVAESLEVVGSEVGQLRKQLDELRGLDTKNETMTMKLMEETRAHQSQYLQSVDRFQASRRVFTMQAKRMLDVLSPKRVDKIIKSHTRSMEASFTTYGMKQSMKAVFDDLAAILHEGIQVVEDTQKLIGNVYQKFANEPGYGDLKPPAFSIREYQVTLEDLFHEGESFRTSMSSTLMEQHLVIQKLYITILAKARKMLHQVHHETANWAAVALSPLVHQIKERKKVIEQRLTVLRKVNQSKESLDAEIQKLEQSLAPVLEQQRELEEIVSLIEGKEAVAPPEESIAVAS
ncbi:dynamin family protein [Methylohalobius crimeensis]|uniref:dynamin family protein n=1 Tax=Methylohalobius crimeensis TaxID=244365 RepID=UPI0004219679|nr:dynamin family protein [Methylohalobius crimeensis]